MNVVTIGATIGLLAGTTMGACASEPCVAAIYGDGFNRPLADGKHHSSSELLIAHRKLPMGSRVRITVVATSRTVVAVVRDRGPFTPGRCADLSLGVAHALGVSGLVKITMDVETDSVSAHAP